ncbi:MAG: Lacal_2735 family protein [Crocinitomicaceae bacterium]|nr:Lacal_2735 family protein [Crocinitomicaceae bacterium]MCF8433812.1 Lacal_2735 family protein [Crocinitomicaceae bacterium]
MFGLFKRKSELEVLQQKYEKLLAEAYKLSSINRSESDKKVGEADVILKQIELLQVNEK